MNTANSHFVHHVLFYLKNPNSAEDKAQLMEGLHALSKVPSIVFSNIGSPANTTRDVIEKDTVSLGFVYLNPQKKKKNIKYIHCMMPSKKHVITYGKKW